MPILARRCATAKGCDNPFTRHGKIRWRYGDGCGLNTCIHISKDVDGFLNSWIMCYEVIACEFGLIDISVLEISLEFTMSRFFGFSDRTYMASTHEVREYFIPPIGMFECSMNASS